ncbi:hypothetical protein C5Q97_08785 [Victivallales bacterium CCUG 44730]|nr:hypothetical protein C5Q97_08785 [Victivallales bacterium CCUG 44730]
MYLGFSLLMKKAILFQIPNLQKFFLIIRLQFKLPIGFMFLKIYLKLRQGNLEWQNLFLYKRAIFN